MIVISLPKLFSYFKEKAIENIEEVLKPEPEKVEVETKVPKRKKPTFVLPEGPNFEMQINRTMGNDNCKQESEPPPVSGGLWTDDDLDELVQLVKKYPGGTPRRWDIIAETIGRSVAEVTYMANKMKNNGYRLPSNEDVIEQPKVKQKTKGGKMGAVNLDSGNWNQQQQHALEEALLKFPKGTAERWDRIADCVANKTKVTYINPRSAACDSYYPFHMLG